MKTYLTLLALAVTSQCVVVNAQSYSQYFDGADTTAWNSLTIEMEDDTSNIWQVGPPQKVLFNAPATAPNVMITDTVNYYTASDTSAFWFEVPDEWQSFGILALQWKQKLDMDADLNGDYGKLEFSVDGGNSWENAFLSPYVYDIYGFNSENLIQTNSGEPAFSGLDTNWRDIWLCYDLSWLIGQEDLLRVKFTFVSDSVTAEHPHEGWMIDNLIAHITFLHTVEEGERENYFNIYPNPADGRINIDIKKVQDFHIIEYLSLTDRSGRLIKEWHDLPTKFFIDTSDISAGMYTLNIRTNLESDSFPIMIEHN